MYLEATQLLRPEIPFIKMPLKERSLRAALDIAELNDAADQELIRLTLAGQARGFEVLVRRYQRLVYNVVFQMVNNHDYAADLTQETFLKAFQGLSSFRCSAPFKPWLLRIATNSTLNAIRYKKLHAHESLDEVLELDPGCEPASGYDVERIVELKITQVMLQDALQHLSVRGRMVFALRYQQDLPYDEIAIVLGVPVTTVKSLLFKTREKLRKILEETVATEI